MQSFWQISGFLIVLPLLIAVVACSDTEPAAEPKAPVSASEVQTKTEAALEAATAYSDQKKEEYQQAITRQLDAATKQIDAVRSQAEQVGQETQAEWKKLMAKLQEQREVVDKKREQLEAASTDAWQETKAALDSAVKELEQTAEKLRQGIASEG